MYMKFPHDHPEWKAQRDAGRLAWKEGRKDKYPLNEKPPNMDLTPHLQLPPTPPNSL